MRLLWKVHTLNTCHGLTVLLVFWDFTNDTQNPASFHDAALVEIFLTEALLSCCTPSPAQPVHQVFWLFIRPKWS